MNIAQTTHAFAAIQSINSGEWDDVLPQLRIAVMDRCAKSDYKAKVLARAEFRAGSSGAVSGGGDTTGGDDDDR